MRQLYFVLGLLGILWGSGCCAMQLEEPKITYEDDYFNANFTMPQKPSSSEFLPPLFVVLVTQQQSGKNIQHLVIGDLAFLQSMSSLMSAESALSSFLNHLVAVQMNFEVCAQRLNRTWRQLSLVDAAKRLRIQMTRDAEWAIKKPLVRCYVYNQDQPTALKHLADWVVFFSSKAEQNRRIALNYVAEGSKEADFLAQIDQAMQKHFWGKLHDLTLNEITDDFAKAIAAQCLVKPQEVFFIADAPNAAKLWDYTFLKKLLSQAASGIERCQAELTDWTCEYARPCIAYGLLKHYLKTYSKDQEGFRGYCWDNSFLQFDLDLSMHPVLQRNDLAADLASKLSKKLDAEVTRLFRFVQEKNLMLATLLNNVVSAPLGSLGRFKTLVYSFEKTNPIRHYLMRIYATVVARIARQVMEWQPVGTLQQWLNKMTDDSLEQQSFEEMNWWDLLMPGPWIREIPQDYDVPKRKEYIEKIEIPIDRAVHALISENLQSGIRFRPMIRPKVQEPRLYEDVEGFPGYAKLPCGCVVPKDKIESAYQVKERETWSGRWIAVPVYSHACPVITPCCGQTTNLAALKNMSRSLCMQCMREFGVADFKKDDQLWTLVDGGYRLACGCIIPWTERPEAYFTEEEGESKPNWWEPARWGGLGKPVKPHNCMLKIPCCGKIELLWRLKEIKENGYQCSNCRMLAEIKKADEAKGLKKAEKAKKSKKPLEIREPVSCSTCFSEFEPDDEVVIFACEKCAKRKNKDNFRWVFHKDCAPWIEQCENCGGVCYTQWGKLHCKGWSSDHSPTPKKTDRIYCVGCLTFATRGGTSDPYPDKYEQSYDRRKWSEVYDDWKKNGKIKGFFSWD